MSNTWAINTHNFSITTKFTKPNRSPTFSQVNYPRSTLCYSNGQAKLQKGGMILVPEIGKKLQPLDWHSWASLSTSYSHSELFQAPAVATAPFLPHLLIERYFSRSIRLSSCLAQMSVWHVRRSFPSLLPTGSVSFWPSNILSLAGVACTFTTSNSRDWLEDNFGFSSIYTDYSDFLRLNPSFNGVGITLSKAHIGFPQGCSVVSLCNSSRALSLA